MFRIAEGFVFIFCRIFSLISAISNNISFADKSIANILLSLCAENHYSEMGLNSSRTGLDEHASHCSQIDPLKC